MEKSTACSTVSLHSWMISSIQFFFFFFYYYYYWTISHTTMNKHFHFCYFHSHQSLFIHLMTLYHDSKFKYEHAHPGLPCYSHLSGLPCYSHLWVKSIPKSKEMAKIKYYFMSMKGVPSHSYNAWPWENKIMFVLPL